MMNCKITALSNAEHLSQLHAGFALLARRSVIRASWNNSEIQSVGPLGRPIMMVECEGRRAVFDVHDAPELDSAAAAVADLYFKRTFIPGSYAERAEIVVPLGMNMPAYCHGDGAVRRGIGGAVKALRTGSNHKLALVQLGRASGMISRFARLNGGRYTADLERFRKPVGWAARGIVLSTRLWDPDRSPANREQRIKMNALRIDLVRAMRDTFGDQFFGGIADDPLSRRLAPDCVIPSTESARKAYLERVSSAAVCVTTVGLQGSVGWRMAEFMALGKAVVAERTDVVHPGGFTAGKHFHAFENVAGCVSSVQALLADSKLRIRTELNALAYYDQFVRPDMLVLQALTRLLQG